MVFWFVVITFTTYGQASDEKQVIALIDQLFTGVRQGDSAVVRRTFAPEVRLHTALHTNELRSTPLEQFLTAIGTPHEEVWDERIIDYQVRIDGPLATAWTPYRFYRGDTFSHCGVNAFQLYHSTAGWKILQITDTRREGGCEPHE